MLEFSKNAAYLSDLNVSNKEKIKEKILNKKYSEEICLKKTKNLNYGSARWLLWVSSDIISRSHLLTFYDLDSGFYSIPHLFGC